MDDVKKLQAQAAVFRAELDQEWRDMEKHIETVAKLAGLNDDDSDHTTEDLLVCVQVLRLVFRQLSTNRLSRFADEAEACGPDSAKPSGEPNERPE